jgi:hypothetical protein
VVELKVGAQVMLTKNMLQVMPSPHSRLAAHLYVHLYTRTCTYIQIYRYIHIYTYIHTYTHR